MNDCIFCKIINKEIPANIVYENDRVISFVDIKGINPGHCLVIPKKHVANLYEFDDQTSHDVFEVVPVIARAVKKAVHADGINLGMNNDAAAGQLIFHAHVHVIPRFSNDGYVMWQGKPSTSEELAELASKIKSAI